MQPLNRSLETYFPEHIGTPRPQQLSVMRALDKDLPDPRLRYYMIDAPVGTGKSAIVSSIVNALGDIGENSVILTPMKFLQDEYSHNFPEIPNLKGRNNYSCPLEDNKRADTAVCAAKGRECDSSKYGKTNCEYYDTKRKALQNFTYVTNFRYFLLAKSQAMSVTGFNGKEIGKRKILIIDEAHQIAEEVVSQVSFSLTNKFLGGRKVNTRGKYIVSDYADELEEAEEYVNDQVDKLTAMAEGMSAKNPELEHVVKKLRQFESMSKRLSWFHKSLDSGVEWICHTVFDKATNSEYVTFDPLYAQYFIDRYLFSGFDKVIMLSGTFMEKNAFLREIGLQNQSYSYQSIPHPFPDNIRPIYFYNNLANLSYANPKRTSVDIPNLVSFMAGMLTSYYKSYKGIMFFPSMALQDEVLGELTRKHPELRPRILSANSDNKEQMVNTHRDTDEPTILCTNSMYQGIDLKGDYSRFQIFVKTPYPSLADKRVKAIADKNPEWYALQTARKMCQGYGRSIRGPDDWADTFILDKAFGPFLHKNKELMPTWFTGMIKTKSV